MSLILLQVAHAAPLYLAGTTEIPNEPDKYIYIIFFPANDHNIKLIAEVGFRPPHKWGYFVRDELLPLTYLAIFATSAGRWARSMAGSSQNSIARSITFRSSRIFPGQ